MTTLEAAIEFGTFTKRQAAAFLREHGLTYAEALEDLGDEEVLNAEALCIWVGY